MLETIAIILFFSFGSSALSHFLDYCMEDGNIFAGYYRFLLRIGKVEADEKTGVITSSRWFYKPLGGCIRCLNFWVGLAVFMAVAYHMDWTPTMLTPLFLIFSGYSFIFLIHIQTKLSHG